MSFSKIVFLSTKKRCPNVLAWGREGESQNGKNNTTPQRNLQKMCSFSTTKKKKSLELSSLFQLIGNSQAMRETAVSARSPFICWKYIKAGRVLFRLTSNMLFLKASTKMKKCRVEEGYSAFAKKRLPGF